MTFQRTIGKRQIRPIGQLQAPSIQQREWMLKMAARRTRAPKGVFRYRSIEEANEDWERWQAAAVADRTAEDEA
jgi:hypothetical protein